MRLRVFMTVLTGLSVLFVTSCGSSRSVQRTESTELRATESRTDTVKEELMVAVHDTIREITTITVQQNEAGDTLKLVQITDRTRASDRAAVKEKNEKIKVVRDTVFIEKRDSVSTTTNLSNPTNKASPVVSGLKWVFWIIIAVIVLTIILKFKSLRV